MCQAYLTLRKQKEQDMVATHRSYFEEREAENKQKQRVYRCKEKSEQDAELRD